MNENINLIVMLTYNDRTVENAYEIFDKYKNSKAEYWGIKEKPLPENEMKKLFSYMKEWGKTTVLEIVEYDEEECLKGAQTALNCNCDILMGTVFYESVNNFCREHNIKYMPFVGDVYGRPSVLGGTAENMIKQAEEYLEKGVYGFDLLSYRYKGDAEQLSADFLSEIDAPVCIAGSINDYSRLDRIKENSPWGFTIGSAFFDRKFGNEFDSQINSVVDYINCGKGKTYV